MAGLFEGLLGGGSDPYELYGDLLNDTQKVALRDQQTTRGLLQAAAIFSKAGQASRLPVSIPWGEAAAAFGGGQDEALKGIMTAAQIRELQSKAKIRDQMFGPEANAKMDALLKAFGMGGGSTGTPAAVPASASGPSSAGTYIPDPAKSALPMVNPALGPVELDAGGTPAVGMPTIPLDAPQGPQTGLLPPPDQVAGLSGPGILAKIAAMQQGGGGGSAAPFGGDQAPSLRLASARVPADPRGMVPIIEEAARRYNVDPAVAVRVAQSEGLGQFYGDKGKSGTAFQLYTGGGLGNEFQKETGLDPLDPKNEPAAIDWVMRNVSRTGWTPYHGARGAGIGPRTGLPGGEDTVIPSGQGGPANMLRTVADTGGGVPGMPPVPVPPGVNPAAMNGLLIELARRNAAAEALGMGNPYGSMLSVLQGSPQYKAAIESATRGAGLPFVRREAEEKAAGTFPFEGELKRYQAELDRANKEAEMLGTARNDPAEIKVSDGQGGEVTVPGTREQKVRAARGLPVPELGITGIFRPGAAGLPPAGSLATPPVERPETLKQQEIDQKFLEEKRVQAESSRRAIMAANDTRTLIEKGVIAGSYADERTRLLKLGQLLNLTGKDDNERIKNTESYIAHLGRGMKEGLKGLGPPVSNVDIQIAEKIAGGQNLTTQGMLELLKLEEKYHRLALQDYSKLLGSAPKSRYDKSVKEPPTFGAPIADNPEGVAHWWDGKAWRPL